MPNLIDEMTEEQKEYEAMKLVNMLDKLSRYCIPIHFLLGFYKCSISSPLSLRVTIEQQLWKATLIGTGWPWQQQLALSAPASPACASGYALSNSHTLQGGTVTARSP